MIINTLHSSSKNRSWYSPVTEGTQDKLSSDIISTGKVVLSTEITAKNTIITLKNNTLSEKCLRFRKNQVL
jgi:hypothetical protein